MQYNAEKVTENRKVLLNWDKKFGFEWNISVTCPKKSKGGFVGGGEDTWEAETDASVLNDVDIFCSP